MTGHNFTFSNKEIDKIVLESKNPHNSLNIEISVARALELIDLNWNDIIFGMQYDYFNIESAIGFALFLIAKGDTEEYVLDISSLDPGAVSKEEFIEIYKPLISKKHPFCTTHESKERILFLLLAFLFKQRNSFENPFHVLEIIYDDFDFPESINCLIPYMQPDGEKDSFEGLYENWERIINNSSYLKKRSNQVINQSADG